MNLRQEILREHSKKQADKIVKWVGASQDRFDELVRLFLNSEYRVVQRAAKHYTFFAFCGDTQKIPWRNN
jgi:hypothetical protein